MARVSYIDLRSFIEQVDRLQALRRIVGADPYLEIGGITEVAAALPDCPALLFDQIKGFPTGFRIFTMRRAMYNVPPWRSESIRR
jgi:3-polyprenyl-4-hydroxybenzoate decarboxylase